MPTTPLSMSSHPMFPYSPAVTSVKMIHMLLLVPPMLILLLIPRHRPALVPIPAAATATATADAADADGAEVVLRGLRLVRGGQGVVGVGRAEGVVWVALPALRCEVGVVVLHRGGVGVLVCAVRARGGVCVGLSGVMLIGLVGESELLCARQYGGFRI